MDDTLTSQGTGKTANNLLNVNTENMNLGIQGQEETWGDVTRNYAIN